MNTHKRIHRFGFFSLFMIAALLNPLSLSWADDVYWVSPVGSDSNDGSQGAPFSTISHALTVVDDIDTIRVLAGDYYEQIILDASLSANEIVLEGYPDGEPIRIISPVPGPVISITGNFSRQTRLRNLHITHDDTTLTGPGIEIIGAPVIIENCRIFNNHSTDNGGGIRIIDAQIANGPLILDCRIEGNRALRGGGLYAENSALQMEYTRLEKNISSADGGAMALLACFDLKIHYNQMSGNSALNGAAIFLDVNTVPLVRTNSLLSNLIYQNIAFGHGGGLFLTGSAVSNSILNNTFAENHADFNGGGLNIQAVSNMVLNKNIIVNNFSGQNGGGIYLQDMGYNSIDIWSSQISGNTAAAEGGAIYLTNCDILTVGGALNLKNNIYHNRAQGVLNGIYSATPIANLILNHNFWGFKESSAVQLQINIPGSNLTGLLFEQNPQPLSQPIVQNCNRYYFGDGYIHFNMVPFRMETGEILDIVTTIDTLFATNQEFLAFPKHYQINFNGLASTHPLDLALYVDQSELDVAGNPPLEALSIISYDPFTGIWNQELSTADVSKRMVLANLPALNRSGFSVGFNTQALDTLLRVFPKPNATDVQEDVTIEVRFPSVINAFSITPQSVKIDGQYSGIHSFGQFYDNATQTLFIRPHQPFFSSEEVTVTLTPSILDINMMPFSEGYSWQFHIGSFKGRNQFQAREIAPQRPDSPRYVLTDIDDDGYPDLTELNNLQLTLFRNSGQAEFVPLDSLNLGGQYEVMAVADIDNDGQKEIVVGNALEMRIIQYAPATGNFVNRYTENLAPEGAIIDILIIDFDNDGAKDICVLRDMDYNYQIDFYFYTLGGEFSLAPAATNILPGFPDRLSAVDINGDGFFDVVANAGSADDNLTLLINNKGSFTRIISSANNMVNQTAFATANVWPLPPSDIRREIILAGQQSVGLTPVIRIFDLNETGNLILLNEETFASEINAFVSADFSSDGRLDMALTLSDGSIQILSNNGAAFTRGEFFSADIFPNQLLAADLDFDGDVDLLAIALEDGRTRWQVLENRSRDPRAFWVDAQVSGGNGDWDKPLSKINDALKRTIDGDSILIYGGTYEERLAIEKNIVIQGLAPVRLLAPRLTAFDSTQVCIENCQQVKLDNLHIFRDDWNVIENGTIASVGLKINACDSIWLQRIQIEGPDIGLKISDAALMGKDLLIKNTRTGWQADRADIRVRKVELSQNSHTGMQISASQVTLDGALFIGNAFDPLLSKAGLWAENNSQLHLTDCEFTENGKANILLVQSSAQLQYCGLFDARFVNGAGQASGLWADNSPQLTVMNTVIAGNEKYGLQALNSQVLIQNNIFGKNDSLNVAAGGGIYLQQSNGRVVNNIFGMNNSAVVVNGGTPQIIYNNFTGNQNNVAGTPAGIGNRFENPLFVRDYFILPGEFTPGDSGYNAYQFKLAPGSPLIDRGDPSLLNGDSSRSDIGLFGNLNYPYVLNQRPLAQLNTGDSSLTISWKAADIQLDSLFAGTAILRGTQDGFVPDTSHLVVFLPKTEHQFVDQDLTFGQDYFYRLTFVDIHGGATGYSNQVRGRLDFLDFQFSPPAHFVQLGQEDTLRTRLYVHNRGTLPLNLRVMTGLPDWLKIMPLTQSIAVNDSAAFSLSFSARGLPRDTLLEHTLTFTPQEAPEATKTYTVRMLVSYRDLLPPLTFFRGFYPDTVFQSLLRFRFAGNDSAFSSIGTPTALLRYQYRLDRLANGDTIVVDTRTTSQTEVRFNPLPDGRYLFRVAALDTVNRGGLGTLSEVRKGITVLAGPTPVLRNVWQMATPSRALNGFAPLLFNENILAVKHWQNGEYVDVSASDLKYGYSYWFISKQETRVNLDGLAFLPEDTVVTVSLNKGWNQIGHPWAWHLSWDSCRFKDGSNRLHLFQEALESGLIRPEVYYNEVIPFRRYERVRSDWFATKVGYWLYANENLTMQYNAKPKAGVETDQDGAGGKILTKMTTSSDILIHLKASQGNQVTRDHYFGRCNRKESYDRLYHSALSPPYLEEQLRLFTPFYNKSWSSRLEETVTDGTMEWDLVLEGCHADDPVVITWDWIQPSESNHLFLYHLQTATWFNLRDQEEYIFESSQPRQQFKLYVSNDEQFVPTILPLQFELSQNYPNPFNAQTTIELAIPYFADNQPVDLRVYDVLGRRVKTLLSGPQSSGYMKINWDGKNENGRPLASGLYLMRLQSRDYQSVKKMILLK